MSSIKFRKYLKLFYFEEDKHTLAACVVYHCILQAMGDAYTKNKTRFKNCINIQTLGTKAVINFSYNRQKTIDADNITQ